MRVADRHHRDKKRSGKSSRSSKRSSDLSSSDSLSKEERKPKTKAVKDDKKDNNEQYDGDWIEVGAKKSSMTKIKVTAAPLPNDNTYIILSDNHGPRKAETTQQPSNSEASNNTTPPIE